MNYDADSYMSRLPTEVLLFIFTLLPAKDLTLCRQVCVRFMQIVDGLSGSESLWRDHCKTDFNSIYQIARLKAKHGMPWYNIYRSLSLWPRLSQAREIREEFAIATCVDEEVQNFRILREGIIGVHKKSAVIYYDIETLEKSDLSSITGEYLKYSENEDTIVFLGYQLHLFIIRKSIKNPCHKISVTFDNVKSFILVNREVYYFNENNEIYVCRLVNENLTRHLITHLDECILCFGYTDQLNILTFEQNIYSVHGKDLVHEYRLGLGTNLLHMLRKYDFLERMDWRVYIQWMYVLNHTIPESLWRDIAAVRVYGDMAFVGSNWGALHIYHAPLKNGEFDLLNLESVKQYDFVEWCNCSMPSMCPITQIDVVECEDGHKVIASMPKKIAVLEFTHNFKKPASVTMFPYSDL